MHLASSARRLLLGRSEHGTNHERVSSTTGIGIVLAVKRERSQNGMTRLVDLPHQVVEVELGLVT